MTHGVAAFTVGDLRTLLSLRANPYEMRPLFAPGHVSDILPDFLWNRTHGMTKHVADVVTIIRQAAWDIQTTAAAEGGRADAPLFNQGAAMIAVDQALRNAGSTQTCTRDDIRLTFEYLTNPMCAAAAWAGNDRSAIVILSPPDEPSM